MEGVYVGGMSFFGGLNRFISEHPPFFFAAKHAFAVHCLCWLSLVTSYQWSHIDIIGLHGGNDPWSLRACCEPFATTGISVIPNCFERIDARSLKVIPKFFN